MFWTVFFLGGEIAGKGSLANFATPNTRKVKILILDELDFLLTRSQDILYNIFNWSQSRKSHLVLMAIANTIDFPDDLKPKTASRIGKRRLIYKTYTAQEIQTILSFRLGE